MSNNRSKGGIEPLVRENDCYGRSPGQSMLAGIAALSLAQPERDMILAAPRLAKLKIGEPIDVSYCGRTVRCTMVEASDSSVTVRYEFSP